MRAFAVSMSFILVTFAISVTPAVAGAADDDAGKRKQIDGMAKETLDTLYKKSPAAKKLYDKAYGYAVFDNLKLAFGISAGGGHGVAVRKGGGEKTYMRMGTGGIGLGLGGKKYQIVFLFETKDRYDEFVEKGWQADAAANAIAGTKSADAETGFKNGMAYYQLTDSGLMLQADIAGTKYWKDKKLNKS